MNILTQKENCVREAIDLVSMLSVEPIFFSPSDKREESMAAKRKFMNYDGDHITLLNVMKEYCDRKDDVRWCNDHFVNKRSMKQVMDVRKQLEQFCVEQGMDPNISCGQNYASLIKCILAGFFKNVAIRQNDGTFKTLGSREIVHLHPGSVLFQTKQECLVFTEWVKTSKSYLRNCSLIQPSWISEVAPHYYAKNSMTTIK
jgi:HrpA-like RNA helicase